MYIYVCLRVYMRVCVCTYIMCVWVCVCAMYLNIYDIHAYLYVLCICLNVCVCAFMCVAYLFVYILKCKYLSLQLVRLQFEKIETNGIFRREEEGWEKQVRTGQNQDSNSAVCKTTLVCSTLELCSL